ncbi:hypothetical protein D3C80_1594500 [compost metagenome]
MGNIAAHKFFKFIVTVPPGEYILNEPSASLTVSKNHFCSIRITKSQNGKIIYPSSHMLKKRKILQQRSVRLLESVVSFIAHDSLIVPLLNGATNHRRAGCSRAPADCF